MEGSEDADPPHKPSLRGTAQVGWQAFRASSFQSLPSSSTQVGTSVLSYSPLDPPLLSAPTSGPFPAGRSGMAARAAITLSKGKGSLPITTLHLRCRVKPGADKTREGVTGLADGGVQLCVAAAPREGEANKAVLKVLSEVRRPAPGLVGANEHAHGSQALRVPKSDLRVIQGLKSRDKIVELTVHGHGGAGEEKGHGLIASYHRRLAGEANDLDPKDRR